MAIVARVDRPLEGVGGIDLGDVGDLGHVQLGGHARGDVLAAGGGREQDVAVVAGDGQHLRGHVLGQAVLELGAVGVDHLGHAGDLAALAASAALAPATSTCTSPPQAAAAVTVFRVEGLMDLLSCSAMTREAT